MLQNTSRSDEIYKIVLNKIINGVKIFIISARKFIIDDCFTKASSITYAIIDIIMHVNFDLPVTAGKSSIKLLIGRLLKKISLSTKKIAGNVTLKDLIEKR